jgi:hypothetical protein
MPQSNRNNNKIKNNQNNLNNANSRNQQSTINSVQVADNSMDDNTHMDDNSNDRWTVVIDLKNNDGKRNYSSSSEQNSPKTTINKNKQFFFTTNRYEILSQIDPVQSSSKSQLNDTHASDVLQNPIKSISIGTKAPLLPPICIRGVIEFTSLCTKLIELIGVDNFYCKASTDRLKIMTANPESYRTLVHFLKEKAEFHTFQLKEDKPLRVVIRNLYPTTSTELIKSELEQRLFDVR